MTAKAVNIELKIYQSFSTDLDLTRASTSSLLEPFDIDGR